MLRGCKQNPVCTKTQRKEQWPPQETEPDLLVTGWGSPVEAQVSSGPTVGVLKTAAVLEDMVCGMSSWRRLPLLQSCWADTPQTGEQLYQRSSQTVAKVLGPTTDFPTWGSGKGAENPQGIWLWRPVRFDYRTSIGLGKQTHGGHKQNLVRTRTQENWAVIPQETEPDLPVSVQESLVEVWVVLGGAACLHKSFRRQFLHYPYHSLASSQTTGREHSPTH